MEEPTAPSPARLPGHHSDSHKLRRYWLVLVERRWLVFCTFLIVVSLGALYAFKASPIYESIGRLQIDPETGGMLSLRDPMTWGSKDPDYLQTQYKALKSRTLIEAVIQKLKLEEDPRYALAEDRVKVVSDDIEIEPERLTRLVIIKARHPDPRRAADIVNTLMDVYLVQNQDRKISKAMAGLTLLKNEAEISEKELIKSIEEIHKYRVDKGMISLVDDIKQFENVDAQALRTARDDFDKQNSRTAEVQKIAEEAEKWKADGRNIADFYGVNQDRLVNDLKARITADESKLAELRTRYLDKHPSVAQVLSSLAKSKMMLTNEANRAYEAILSNVQVERAREVQARKKLDEAERRISELNAARTTYDVLNRKKERNEFFYQQILAKVREINLNTKDTLANITVDFRAVPQPRYVKPKRPLILAASIVMGVGFAVALAFFVNLLDDSIKSQEDVENYLGANFLGYIPKIKVGDADARGLHTHLVPTSTASEGFRTMRASVALARNSDKVRSIAITSTIPEEGKSLFASNFAIVTAQTGVKTLLVDADLRRPLIQKLFKLQSTHGLAGYLSDPARSFEETVRTTEVPNLSVVCCGKLPNNPAELLGSKRMVQFLKEACQQYDRVILDCAPISAVADPLVVASLADGVVYVTKFNKVRRDNVLRSVQRLQDAGIRLVGIVINDIDFEGKHSYHTNYHYHQNRYYESHYANRGGRGDASQSSAKRPQEPNRG